MRRSRLQSATISMQLGAARIRTAVHVLLLLTFAAAAFGSAAARHACGGAGCGRDANVTAGHGSGHNRCQAEVVAVSCDADEHELRHSYEAASDRADSDCPLVWALSAPEGHLVHIVLRSAELACDGDSLRVIDGASGDVLAAAAGTEARSTGPSASVVLTRGPGRGCRLPHGALSFDHRAAPAPAARRRLLVAAPDATSLLDCQPRTLAVGGSLACTLLPRASGAAVSAQASAFVLFPPSSPSLPLASLSVPASADRFEFTLQVGSASGPLSAAAHAAGAAANVTVPVTVTAEPDATTTVEFPDNGGIAVGASVTATIVLRRGGRPAYADRSSVASIAAWGALSSAALLAPRTGLAFTLAATVAAGPASETGNVSLALASGLTIPAAGSAIVYAEPDISSLVECPNIFLVLSGGPVTCTIRPRLGSAPVYALRSAFQAPVESEGFRGASLLGAPEGPAVGREFTSALGFSQAVEDDPIQFNLAVGTRSPVLVVVRGKPTAATVPYTYLVAVQARLEHSTLTCPARHLFVNETAACALVPVEAGTEEAPAGVRVAFGAEFRDPDPSLYGALQSVEWPAPGDVSSGFSVRVRAGSTPGNGTLGVSLVAVAGDRKTQQLFVWSLPDATSSVRCPSSSLVVRGAPVPLSFEARSNNEPLPSVPWAFAGRGFSAAQSTGRLAYEPEDYEAYVLPVEAAAATSSAYPGTSFEFAVATAGIPTGPARLTSRLALFPAGAAPLSCPVFIYDAPDNSTELSCPRSLIKSGERMNCSVTPRREGERVHALFASLSSLASAGAAVTIAGWAEPPDALPRRAFNFSLYTTDATGPSALSIPFAGRPAVTFPLTVYQDPDATSTVDCGGAFLVTARAVNCTVRPRREGRAVHSPSSAFALELRPRAGRRLLGTPLPLPGGVSDAFVTSFTAPAAGLFELYLTVNGGSGPASVSVPLQTQLEVGGLLVTAPTLLGTLEPLLAAASLANGSDATYRWSFGDGAVGYGAAVSHYYATNGTYTITLSAENNVSSLRWSGRVQVETPIENLTLNTGSPVPWKASARLRASVAGGSNVQYVIRVLEAGAAQTGPFVFNAASAQFLWPDRGQYRVQVEARNARYSASLTVAVSVEAFEILQLEPPQIRSAGGVSVTVRGRRFVNGFSLRCQFDVGAMAEVSEATFLTSEAIACSAPSHPAGNSTVSVAYDTEVPNKENTLQLEYLTCKPGEFQANYRFVCSPCDPGFYSPDGLLSSCMHCPDGTFQPAPGQAGCRDCPANAGTIPGASSLEQCVCKPGYWGTAYLGDGCAACPPGTDCSRSNTTYPPAQPGRWIARGDPSVALTCDPPEACPGGVELCSDGFAGFRCGQCAPGHYRINGQCSNCSGKEPPFVGIVSIFLAIIFIYSIFSARSFSRTDKIGDSVDAVQTFVQLLQAFSLIAQSRLNWPPLVKMLAGWLTALNINPQIARPECSAGAAGAGEAFLLQWKLTLASPLILIAAGVVQVALLFLWSRFAARLYNGLRAVFPRLRPLEDKPPAEEEEEEQGAGKKPREEGDESERRRGSAHGSDRDDVTSTASRAPAPPPSYALPPETCMQTLDEMEAVLLRLRAAKRVAVKAEDRRLATAAGELEALVEAAGNATSTAASRESAERLWRAVGTLRDVPTAEFEGKPAESLRAERALRALRPEPESGRTAPIALPERLGWACDDLLALLAEARGGTLLDDESSAASSVPKQAPDGRLEWCATEADALAQGEPDTVFATRVDLLVKTALQFEAADFGSELHAPLGARLERSLGHLYELCVLHAFKPQGPEDAPSAGFFAAAARRLRRVGRTISQRPAVRYLSMHLMQSRARFRRILADGLRGSARFKGDARTWILIILVHVQAAGIFYTIAFQQIAQMSLAPFVCRANVNGESFLVAEPAIPCRPGEQPWAGMRGVSILATIVYLGIVPVLLTVAAWYFYTRVDTWAGEAHHDEQDGRHLNRFGIPRMLFCKALFGFHVLAYRHELCYWGLVILARRFAIVLVQTVTPLEKYLLQALLNFLVVFIALLLQAWRKPYGEQRGNRMALAVLMAYMFQLFSGLIFVYPELDDTTSLVTQLVLLGSFLVCFVMMFRILVLNQIYERKHRALFALTEAVRGELRLNSAMLVAIDPWWQGLGREKKHLMEAYVQNVAEIVRSDVCGKNEQFRGRGARALRLRRRTSQLDGPPKPAGLEGGDEAVRDAERAAPASGVHPGRLARGLELEPAASGTLEPTVSAGGTVMSGRRACAYLFRDKAMWAAHLIRGRRREAPEDDREKDRREEEEILRHLRELREGGRRRRGLRETLLARYAERQRRAERERAVAQALAQGEGAAAAGREEGAAATIETPRALRFGPAVAMTPPLEAGGGFLGEFDADPRDVTVEWPGEGPPEAPLPSQPMPSPRSSPQGPPVRFDAAAARAEARAALAREGPPPPPPPPPPPRPPPRHDEAELAAPEPRAEPQTGGEEEEEAEAEQEEEEDDDDEYDSEGEPEDAEPEGRDARLEAATRDLRAAADALGATPANPAAVQALERALAELAQLPRAAFAGDGEGHVGAIRALRAVRHDAAAAGQLPPPVARELDALLGVLVAIPPRQQSKRDRRAARAVADLRAAAAAPALELRKVDRALHEAADLPPSMFQDAGFARKAAPALRALRRRLKREAGLDRETGRAYLTAIGRMLTALGASAAAPPSREGSRVARLAAEIEAACAEGGPVDAPRAARALDELRGMPPETFVSFGRARERALSALERLWYRSADAPGVRDKVEPLILAMRRTRPAGRPARPHAPAAAPAAPGADPHGRFPIALARLQAAVSDSPFAAAEADAAVRLLLELPLDVYKGRRVSAQRALRALEEAAARAEADPAAAGLVVAARAHAAVLRGLLEPGGTGALPRASSAGPWPRAAPRLPRAETDGGVRPRPGSLQSIRLVVSQAPSEAPPAPVPRPSRSPPRDSPLPRARSLRGSSPSSEGRLSRSASDGIRPRPALRRSRSPSPAPPSPRHVHFDDDDADARDRDSRTPSPPAALSRASSFASSGEAGPAAGPTPSPRHVHFGPTEEGPTGTPRLPIPIGRGSPASGSNLGLAPDAQLPRP